MGFGISGGNECMGASTLVNVAKNLIFLWFLHLERQRIPLCTLIYLNSTIIVSFSILHSKKDKKKSKLNCSQLLLQAFIHLNRFMF